MTWTSLWRRSLEGRIAAVADVYDAITSNRVYRAALPTEEAVAVIRKGRRTQFDPLILDLFLEMLGEADAEEETAPAPRANRSSAARSGSAC